MAKRKAPAAWIEAGKKHRIKKGQVLNPAGVNHAIKLKQEAAALFNAAINKDEKNLLVEAILNSAYDGDVAAQALAAAYAWGKPTQRHEIDYKGLTDAELKPFVAGALVFMGIVKGGGDVGEG